MCTTQFFTFSSCFSNDNTFVEAESQSSADGIGLDYLNRQVPKYGYEINLYTFLLGYLLISLGLVYKSIWFKKRFNWTTINFYWYWSHYWRRHLCGYRFDIS